MDAKCYFEQGVQKSLNKDYHGAIKDYTLAIKLSSSVTPRTITEKHPEGYTSQINVYDINEGNTSMYFNRGLAYFDLGMFDEAIMDFTKIIEYTPNDAEAYFHRAKTNYCLNNDEYMKEDLASACKIDSKYTTDYFFGQFQR